MELSSPLRPSYQPFTSSYSSLSVKSRLYAIPARTSSFWASSVPVVARSHQASLDAFSAGARRSSNEAMKPCISAGEAVIAPLWREGGSAAVAPAGAGAALAEVDRNEQQRDAEGSERCESTRPARAPDDERRYEDERHACPTRGSVSEVRRYEPDHRVQDRRKRRQRE